ncbi:MAG: SIR2 family protein [Deltaproteobacteria bacterium]|nr:SIR2 family protein [Deltaproteobacteria bacterium]
MNDPYRQIEILQQALASDKSRIAFFLGAGCPFSIRIQDGDDNRPLILDIAGLTDMVCKNLTEKNIDKLVARIPLKEDKQATIEDILSHVRLLIEVVGSGKIDDFTKANLEELERKICEEITKAASKELPDNETSYHKLASWIRDIQRNNPVEIFTPNYDLLIESALESKNIPYFDGFVGSRNAFFDLHSIEHEELPARWVRLWKLHGSINWWKDSAGNVFRGPGESTENKQMIYPSHLKYEKSRRMPYFAMQDRLGYFLATGQAVLVTCGYSFIDKHLNAIILQRLSANPRAICFGLLYDDLEKYPEALARAKETTNLTLIANNGAFKGGQQISWNTKESHALKHYDFCLERKKINGGEDSSVKCNIGDFQVLGKFLLNQIGYTHKIEEDRHAN